MASFTALFRTPGLCIRACHWDIFDVLRLVRCLLTPGYHPGINFHLPVGLPGCVSFFSEQGVQSLFYDEVIGRVCFGADGLVGVRPRNVQEVSVMMRTCWPYCLLVAVCVGSASPGGGDHA